MTEDKYQDCKASPLMFIYLFYLFNFDKYCKRNSIDFFFLIALPVAHRSS